MTEALAHEAELAAVAEGLAAAPAAVTDPYHSAEP